MIFAFLFNAVCQTVANVALGEGIQCMAVILEKTGERKKKKKKEMEVESKFGAAIVMPTSSTHKTYSLPPAEPGRFKITELTKMVR